MPNAKIRTVDEYIASKPIRSRKTLEIVRKAILRALPDAEETLSYDMPAYKLRGSTVLQFAGWEKHYALYGASEPILARLKKELADYEVGKGTIRFPLGAAVPEKLIEDIAKLRAESTKERGG